MAVEPQGGKHAGPGAVRRPDAPGSAGDQRSASDPLSAALGGNEAASGRGVGRRRTGPARERVAANDDAPSIGTLIYALQQQPANTPYYYASIGTGLWLVLGVALSWGLIGPGLKAGDSVLDVLVRPTTIAAVVLALAPIALIWFLALLVWRAQELRLMSSAMTEVAVRLAEPDRMAEQSIAALGQSVRRQVAAMNDAISRAIGRAGELESLVHNEVSSLERSYDENENRIRNLIDELVSEREALSSGSERVADTLKGVGQQISENIYSAGASVAEQLSDRGNVLQSSLTMISQRIGGELPGLLDKLSQEQGRLALIVEGATSNLDNLQIALDERTGRLDTSLGMRTKQLQTLLQDYSTTIDSAIAEHADTLQSRLGNLTQAIENTNIHIENVLQGRTDALDAALVERTKAIDNAFAVRMAEIDESIARSGMAVEGAISRGLRSVEAAVAQGASVVDGAISGRVETLRAALERHASSMGSTLRQQSEQLESTLGQGLEAMRRNTEVITTQSAQTVSGLSAQGRMLKEVSEGLIGQLQGLVDRFDQQSRMVSQVTTTLESSQGRLSGTSRDMAAQLSKLAQDINTMTTNVQTHMANLPAAARDSASGVRLALQDQIRALDALAGLSNEQRAARDVVPAEGQDFAVRRAAAGSMADRLQPPQPLSAQPVAAMPAQTLSARTPLPGFVAVPAPAAIGQREGWSLGDLLARASREEAESPVAKPASFDLGGIAAAIDPATAAAVWSRLRSGDRGAVTRSIYSPAGQQTFDQIVERMRTDGGFRAMMDRYLADFERVLQQSEQQDPSGRTTLAQIQGDTGRIYLLLAHAGGRLG